MSELPTSQEISTKQARIATLAKQMPGVSLRSLSQHIDEAWMREAFRRTRKGGAVGVDRQTADDFAGDLEGNLRTLVEQAKSGRYRAPPVRRVHIPKGKGQTRPIGIPTFADKVLQRAVVMALQPVFEEDFYDFSYGFRPKRSAHDALEALWRATMNVEGGWVLDVDVQGFFDSLDRGVCRDLLRQRVCDGVLVRLVGKWLNAGVLEDGVLRRQESGTPQGGVISPLLANIYLHYVLDEWWVRDVQPRLRGRAQLIRYADDFVIVCEQQEDAVRVQNVLPKRFGKYGLQLHPDKTRLVRFGRPRGGDDDDYRRGKRPETFDFLGFTHYWGQSRKGRPVVKRKTAKDRLNKAIQRIADFCRKARHEPIPEQASMLQKKLRGHYQYYGITGNIAALARFLRAVEYFWRKSLGRRSQRAVLTSDAFKGLLERHPLPLPTVARSIFRTANR
jgi:group II intron reverse transcriptase/maturase